MRLRTSLATLLLGTAPAAAAEQSIAAEIELGSVEDVETLQLSDLLDRPVTSASGYAAKPSDSPTLVSTLDRETIDRFGYRTVRDALMGMRGVYVGNDRNYSYLGARGFSIPGDYNTRFALSIDGHLTNDAVYGQASIGAELGLPMIAIERIEMVRGGAWSVHGENALLGAIQIVTASGATRPGLHVTSTTRATRESFDDPTNRPSTASRGEDVSASYGLVKNGVDVFVAGTYSYDPGVKAFYTPELVGLDEPCVDARGRRKECDGIVWGGDLEQFMSTYASLRTKRVEAHVLASKRRKLVPTAAFGSLVGMPIETIDDDLYGNLKLSHTTDSYDLIGRVGADYFQYFGQYPYANEPEMAADGVGLLMNRDAGVSSSIHGELRGRYKWATAGEHISNVEVAAGARAMAASVRQYGRYDYETGPEYYMDRTDPTKVVSLFGHTSARAFDHVVGFAAVRGDYHADTFGLVVSPQVGLVLDGGEHGRIRASVSRGYRPPTPYERFFATANGLPPSDLDPELSETRELSLERFLGDNMRLLVVGFQQKVDGLIAVTPDADGTGIFSNVGGASSYGVEAELEGRWDRLQFAASYTRLSAKTDDGMTPANSPASLAALRLMAPIAGGKADVGVESFFVNRRTSFDGSMLDPLFTTNAVVNVREVAKSLDLSLGVTNLFDERSGDPGSEEHRQSRIPHDPRTLWLRLSVRLDP